MIQLKKITITGGFRYLSVVQNNNLLFFGPGVRAFRSNYNRVYPDFPDNRNLLGHIPRLVRINSDTV